MSFDKEKTLFKLQGLYVLFMVKAFWMKDVANDGLKDFVKVIFAQTTSQSVVDHQKLTETLAIEDELEVLLEKDPRLSSVELAKQLSVSHTTVLRHLHALGKVYKVDKWVPHSLTERNLNQRLTTCISHLARYKKKDFCGKL